MTADMSNAVAKGGEKTNGVDSDSEPEMVPDMALAEAVFRVIALRSLGKCVENEALAVIDKCKEKNMGPWYEFICENNPEAFVLDGAMLKAMKLANAETLKELDAAIVEAEKDGGDMEILDALFAKARHFSQIGDKENALKAYNYILDLPKVSIGKRIDAIMSKTRVGLFFLDMATTKGALEATISKVYEALYLIKLRDMKKASQLLCDSVATFTCTELCSYEEFMFYTIVTNTLHLTRTDLKKLIIDGPEVAGFLSRLPHAAKLVQSLYACKYQSFMEAILELNEKLFLDRYFSQHARYMLRELRILAYSQFLNAYKSVILQSMADEFGVSIKFLDEELARFISSGRLCAKIDKVSGVVESNRPDKKNGQYQQAIKIGDALLARIQRLQRKL